MAFERSQGSPAPAEGKLPERALLIGLALWIGFAVVAAGLYSPAFTGPFISDDYGYYVSHPYTERVDAESLREMFDPWGPAKLYTASYAPLHLLATALERQLFGDVTLGHHLVNTGLHALVSVLLVLWLWQLGVARVVAVGAGLLFLAHPANVEAVAWASQLGTLLGLSLALAALLCLSRSAAAATLCFLLALLSSSAALFALPAAAALAWTRGADRGLWGWLAGWALLAVVYAFPHAASFEHVPAVDVPAFDDPLVHLSTIAAIGMRYLAMAVTSYGVSAWQEPLPAESPDGWVIGGVAFALFALARTVIALRARSPEAACWIAAGAAFLPVSQIVPFATPMADRYLYFMLPGLLGGSLLLARALAARLEIDVPRLEPLLAALAFALVFFLGWRSAERTPLWQAESLLLLDAALHYPHGTTASFMRARRAAQDGDVEQAIVQLRHASERGLGRFMALPEDPGLAPLRDEPAFRALVREMAGRWIARAEARGYESQPELRVLGIAHMQREEYPEAVVAFQAALDAGGPMDHVIERELAEARGRLASARAGDVSPPRS